MNSTNTIRVACLGAGYFSRFHFDGWRRIERTEIVGVASREIGKARDTGLPAFATLEEMLSATRPDLLDIITPPETHLEAIRRALSAGGIRAIICQKPFCRSLEEARQATELAEAAGVDLVIHENFRFQPWYRVMREAIADGLVGDVLQLTFRLRTGDGQGPAAYLDRQPYFQTMPRLLIHETGVHWIDTFRFLLGEPEAVYADLRRLNPVIRGEDAGYIIFDYPGGVRALFDGNRLLDHSSDSGRTTFGEALLEGTRGTLTLDGDGRVLMRTFGTRDARELLAPRDWPGFAGDCVHALMQHVVKGMLDGTPLENRARDYLKVIATEQAVYEASRTGCKIREFIRA